MNKTDIIKAKCSGTIKAGNSNIGIPCAVLEDGTRVISEHGLVNCFGGIGGSAKRQQKEIERESGAEIPLFAASRALQPFVSKALIDLPRITYSISGRAPIIGYDVKVLSLACRVFIDAALAGELHHSQKARLNNAYLLMIALSAVGEIALVDEATGHQGSREADALQKKFREILLIEHTAWQKIFPDEFFENLAKVFRQDIRPGHSPGFVGVFINRYVYATLDIEMANQIKSLREENDSTAAMHQFLPDEIRNEMGRIIANINNAAVLADFDKETFYHNIEKLMPSKQKRLL